MKFLRSHFVAISLLALLATLPLLVNGPSCGHDMPFHVQSWLDAAQQLRHGTAYPRWAFSPAWQAGEPRFVFYPPLSWFLGALLTMLVPMNAVPIVFTWLALTGAGFSMYHLARKFASPAIALLCASVYLANPYMLFNAFERGAFAELLAATWMPLVILSAVEAEPSLPRIAIPLALAWLTNAPAGVMATYASVLLFATRLVLSWLNRRRVSTKPTLVAVSGMTLGLLLPAFYLLPAAYERRFVQVEMAIIPNLRYQDNFLFSKTDYAAHNAVTFSVSVLALVMLAVALAVTGWNSARARKYESEPSRTVCAQMLAITLVIGFLLLPISGSVWEHLPNLKFLQFPWRLLSVLSVVLACALALSLTRIRQRFSVFILASVVVVFGLSQLGSHLYRQGCEANDYPAFESAAFRSGHGVMATDEYTALTADNDVQRTDNPGYWLVQGDDPNEPAPGTIQNPNETIANYDKPIPFENTVAARAPSHIGLDLKAPATLVLNLRDYPAWRVTRNSTETPQHLQREDGLIALALPAGSSSIDVHWVRSRDQNLGIVISLVAAAVLAFLLLPSRKMKS